MSNQPMSPSDVTPPTPEAAKAIRKQLDEENTAQRNRIDARLAGFTTQLGRMEQSVAEIPGLVTRLHGVEADRIVKEVRGLYAESDKRLVELLSRERQERHRQVVESERRSNAYTDAEVDKLRKETDSRFIELDLKLGVHTGHSERAHASVLLVQEVAAVQLEDVTGKHKLTEEEMRALRGSFGEMKTKVDEHESWFQTHKAKAGYGLGGAGLTVAVYSAAPHAWGWAKDAFHWIASLFAG